MQSQAGKDFDMPKNDAWGNCVSNHGPINEVSKGTLTRRYISFAGFPIRSDSFQDPCQPWWWAIWCAGQRLESPG